MKTAIIIWLWLLAILPANGTPVIGDCAPQITKKDRADIQDLIRLVTTPRAEIWLLAADDTHFEIGGRTIIRLTVYLPPKRTSARVRHGDYLCLHNGHFSGEKGARKIGRWIYEPKEGASFGGSYACVARLPYRFLNHDGRVGDPLEGPMKCDLNSPPTDEDLIAIGDAIRHFFLKQNDLCGDSNWTFVRSFTNPGSRTDGCYQVSDQLPSLRQYGSKVDRMIYWRLNHFTTLLIGLKREKTGWSAQSEGVSQW